jgi:hypothetical protein
VASDAGQGLWFRRMPSSRELAEERGAAMTRHQVVDDALATVARGLQITG